MQGNTTLLFGGAAVVGVGYLAYKNGWLDNFLHSPTTTSPAPTTAGTPPVSTVGPVVVTTTPTTVAAPATLPPASDPKVAALTAAALGDAFFVGGKADADHWAYYWNRLYTPLTGEQFTAAFGGDRGPAVMSASEFVGRVRAIGLSGFRARVPRAPGGISAGLLGIRVPGLGRTVSYSFYGYPMTATGVEDELASVEQGWEQARGNGTGYADCGVQRQPQNCDEGLRSLATDICNTTPERCSGISIDSVIASLCGKYSGWYSAMFPNGCGDAYNYSPQVWAQKFPGAPQPDVAPSWATSLFDSPVSSPAPTPVLIQQSPLPSNVQTMIAPAPSPAPSSTSTNAGSGAPAAGFNLSGTVKIGGYDVPVLALAGVALVGAYFMFKGGR